MSPNLPNNHKQKGVVLVVALFVMALVSVLATMMISRLDRDIRRSELWGRTVQAEQYAQGSILWAEEQLKNNLLNQRPGKLVDIMPTVSPSEEVNGFKIQSTIEDMQARFNLNNLTQESAQLQFRILLRAVNPQLNEGQADEIVKATTAFINPVMNTKGSIEYMKYMEYYGNLSQPYLPASRLLVSVSEWRLVKGVTSDLYETMRAYLTTLPMVTPINVQTATLPVLMSLSPNFSVSAVQELIALRRQTPFVDKEVFMNLPIIKNNAISLDLVTTISQFFLVKTEINIADQKVILYTLLERHGDQGKVEINKLWQSKGLW